MNCPKCGKEMKTQASAETENSQNGKKYDKVVFVCEPDDVWITIETPKETNFIG